MACLLASGGLAQERAAESDGHDDAAKKPATISGIVVSDFDEKPLKRASVILRPRLVGANSLADFTGENGRFSFARIPAGSYSIVVICDGYIPTSTGRVGAYRMPPLLRIESGQNLNDYTFRLHPWGVISGKIIFEDGQPGVGIAVQLYREYHTRGKHGFMAAGEAHADDLGLYRIHGLVNGSYYVAALYQKPLPAGAVEETHADASGRAPPEQGYTVTFYPSAQRLAEAVPVMMNKGEEVAAIDIVLKPVTTVRIRGRVIGGLSGKSIQQPTIALERIGADEGVSIPVPIHVAYPSQGEFEISGVSAGPYLLLATGNDDEKTLSARAPVTIGDSDITGLSIVVAPPVEWKGKILVDGDDDTPSSGMRVVLEPRRQSGQPLAADIAKDHSFAIAPVPGERYDIDVAGMPDGAYVKSAKVAEQDVLREGFEPGPVPVPISIVVSTGGGRVVGIATTDNAVAATGATVSLIPDPMIGRTQQYRTGYVDQNGFFRIPGVAPGNYIALAWYDEAPCDLYDPQDIERCRSRGAMLVAAEGADTPIQLRVAQ